MKKQKNKDVLHIAIFMVFVGGLAYGICASHDTLFCILLKVPCAIIALVGSIVAVECVKEKKNNLVCTWTYIEKDKTSPLETSCGKVYYRQDEVGQFAYCPYCGGKMERKG